jgi:hypothetical protein
MRVNPICTQPSLLDCLKFLVGKGRWGLPQISYIRTHNNPIGNMPKSENYQTPLIKKLGIQEGQNVIFLNTPAHFFSLLGTLPVHVTGDILKHDSADFIHLFCTRLSELEFHFADLKKALKKDGMIWISWPKRSSSVASELDGNIVRRYGLMQGLVDVKVCAIDKDWSGLKFMYRRKDRK